MAEQDNPSVAEATIAAERRRTRRLWYFWAQRRRNRRLPAFSEFDPHRLPVAWSACFVLSVARDSKTPVFDYIGPELAGPLGEDFLGRPASAAPQNTLLGAAVHNLDSLFARREPIIAEGRIADAKGGTILYRSIVLPFGADGETVDRVLGAVTFCALSER